MRKIKETIADRVASEFANQISSTGVLSQGIDAIKVTNDMIKKISSANEDENKEQIIKKPFKTIKVSDLIGKNKMKKPIGKLTYMEPSMDESNDVQEKWSEKYKRSIDCNNPKGFSQKAHCQGRKKKVNEEKLEGGKSDNMSLIDIAKKHVGNEKNEKVKREKIDKMVLKLKKQLEKGIKTEMEHTKNRTKAKEITMDHLIEDPQYYDKLKKIETKETTSASSGAFVGPVGFDPNSDFVKRSFSEKPKKVETKEATGASSAGQYQTNKIWAKSMNKKDWKGASKTQIPGGKFVQVKKKCKTFPYCNQGDIKALKLFENEIVKKVITKVSKENNISENVIKNIIAYEYEKIRNNK